MSEPPPEPLRHLIVAESDAPVTRGDMQAAVRARLGATLGIATVAATTVATTSATATAATTSAATTTGATTAAATTAATTTAATTTIATTGAVAAKSVLTVKLVGLVLGVGAAGAVATTVVASRDTEHRPAVIERAPSERAPSERAPTPAPSQIRVEPIEVPIELPIEEPLEEPTPVVEATPPPSPVKRNDKRSVEPPQVEPPPVESPPARTQRQLLADATRSLSVGEPARALELIDEDARIHATGPLSEEREALRISVLKALGRISEARDAARHLLATYPHTIHRRLAEQTLAQEAP